VVRTMDSGDKFPWLSEVRKRILGIGVSDATKSAFCRQVRSLIETHNAYVGSKAGRGTSPIVAMLGSEAARLMSGVKYFADAGTTVDKVTTQMFVKNAKSWFVDATPGNALKNAGILLTKMLDDGFHSRSGIPRIELVRGPNQLVRDVMHINEKDNSVKLRNFLLLPFMTVGTCRMCQGDQRTALLCALQPDRPQPKTGTDVRDIRSRSIFDQLKVQEPTATAKKNIGEFRIYSALLNGVNNALEEVKTPDEEGKLAPANMLPLLIPEDDVILYGIAGFRMQRSGVTSFDIRLTCSKCLSKFNDPTRIRIAAKNARFIMELVKPNLPQGAHDARKAWERTAEKYRKTLRQLERAAEDTPKGEGVITGSPADMERRHRSKGDIHDLCVELIAAGLDDMVLNARDVKSKTKQLKLKKNVRVNDAATALETQKALAGVVSIDMLSGMYDGDSDATVPTAKTPPTEGAMIESSPEVEIVVVLEKVPTRSGVPGALRSAASLDEAPKANAKTVEWRHFIKGLFTPSGIKSVDIESMSRAECIKLWTEIQAGCEF
jgi:hypothetical protein